MSPFVFCRLCVCIYVSVLCVCVCQSIQKQRDVAMCHWKSFKLHHDSITSTMKFMGQLLPS